MNKNLDLTNILNKHEKWLKSEEYGFRANMSYANLSYADLRHADFSCTYLMGANLSYDDLSGVDLSHANLSGANLTGAYLSHADLSYTDLNRADLTGADLRHADLRHANLTGAVLIDANLNNVMYDEKTAFFAMICPEEGSFIGWKKLEHNCVAKLLIPKDAKRSSATTRKCRASKAIVLEIYDENGDVMDDDFIGLSRFNHDFQYKKGQIVIPDSFDEDRWNECSSGIHFFITRKEAELY